ncbi:hypothetical protein C8J57DRAFT_1606386 [Mycena rebaudengoi]|nr:hypothetical protein C8J57DRAFT_1606386 [Mycena rebaudengoi]
MPGLPSNPLPFAPLTLSYVNVAFLTLLSYDVLLNFSEEYHHIWKSKWSLIKCLYLWSRYGPFVDTTIAVLRGGGTISDDQVLFGIFTSCKTLAKFNTIFSIFGIGVTEIILIIRTYALYGSSKKVLTFCVVVWLSVGGICTWATITWSKSVVTDINFYFPCDFVEGSRVLVACYVSLLIGETVIVLLTLWKFVHYKVSGVAGFRSSRLITSFYRDGIMFYVAMLAIFIGIVAIQLLNKRFDQIEFKLLGLTPLRVMHSILVCQLVIHVRAIASDEDAGTVGKSKSLLFANLQADNRCGVDTATHVPLRRKEASQSGSSSAFVALTPLLVVLRGLALALVHPPRVLNTSKAISQGFQGRAHNVQVLHEIKADHCC